ncbi:MAG: beta-lactamase family protein [Bacteroidetes bacterium]|nr:beta-lactamase family protein [Bacteroidota bacterium]
MKKVLFFLGISIICVALYFLSVRAYEYYKLVTFHDTHDLQDQISGRCSQYIEDKETVGLSIGLIQGEKVFIRSFGLADKDDHRPVDSATVFEIGSITKVFTAELAQIMVDRGELSWQETIYDVLPEVYKPLGDDNTTLLSLATHTSGFPRNPKLLNSNIKNECDPYADISRTIYASCLKDLADKKKPDSATWVYSNIAFSVLANCIESRAGCTYDSLLRREIVDALSLRNTTTHDTDPRKYAAGYDRSGNKTCHWNLPPFYTGCGGIRSDIIDMTKFLEANLHAGTLYKPFSETQIYIYGNNKLGLCKGWQINKPTPGLHGLPERIVWKNGGTGGFRSYIGMIPEKHIGVIILSNQANETLTDFGQQLLILASKVSMK